MQRQRTRLNRISTKLNTPYLDSTTKKEILRFRMLSLKAELRYRMSRKSSMNSAMREKLWIWEESMNNSAVLIDPLNMFMSCKCTLTVKFVYHTVNLPTVWSNADSTVCTFCSRILPLSIVSSGPLKPLTLLRLLTLCL